MAILFELGFIVVVFWLMRTLYGRKLYQQLTKDPIHDYREKIWKLEEELAGLGEPQPDEPESTSFLRQSYESDLRKARMHLERLEEESS